MNSIVLEEFRALFKDEASFDRFVEIVSKQLEHDMAPVVSNQKVLGAIMSPESAKDYLYERLSRRICESPAILDEIRDRIENDQQKHRLRADRRN